MTACLVSIVEMADAIAYSTTTLRRMTRTGELRQGVEWFQRGKHAKLLFDPIATVERVKVLAQQKATEIEAPADRIPLPGGGFVGEPETETCETHGMLGR